jgi:hypothetical protein
MIVNVVWHMEARSHLLFRLLVAIMEGMQVGVGAGVMGWYFQETEVRVEMLVLVMVMVMN